MKLYRYITSTDIDEHFKHETLIGCASFEVVRETKACFVIKYKRKDKFILKNQIGKRFAYTTKKQALNSFDKRSKARINILEEQLRRAKIARSIFKNTDSKLLDIESYEWND